MAERARWPASPRTVNSASTLAPCQCSPTHGEASTGRHHSTASKKAFLISFIALPPVLSQFPRGDSRTNRSRGRLELIEPRRAAPCLALWAWPRKPDDQVTLTPFGGGHK